ncbi:MAG: DeoR family transcriptional regulator [Methanosarcinales archaeon]|nr:MAG: DeoR family transcriptional regulator [Methanosarcinales archaeon]
MIKLKDLLKEGESETVEFKPSLSQMDKITESISAFSNTKGGTVVIGVSDKGEVLGVDIGKNTIESLANQIKQNTDPMAYPSIRVEESDKKQVVVIEVVEAEQKPVLAFGRAFMRVGKSNQKLGFERIRNLALETSKVYWDERVCEAASLDDIDEKKVRWFLKRAKYERRLDLDPEAPLIEALEKLELLREGKLINAAILLFGKNPQRFVIQSETRCARFKGIKPLEFIDMKVFGGNIIDQREDAVEFAKEHIKLHAKIVGMERIETWEYPIEAIREAITNAICHRDYEMSANVQVRIFDDRIEIWGCGYLPKPLTVEALKQEHISILRNYFVGKCFFLIKFIEQWGTGTNRIIDSCLDHGFPEPVFEELSGSLVVTLRKGFTEELLKEKGLNERQMKAVSYIREKGSITNKEYNLLFDVSRITATRDLKLLEKEGIVKRIGTGRRHLEYVLK